METNKKKSKEHNINKINWQLLIISTKGTARGVQGGAIASPWLLKKKKK
jgi:hypothetical protein